MGQAKHPLKAGDTGPYGEIAARPSPAGLVLLFVPSLAALLTRAEQLKGSPLTEAEVVRVRDASTVLVSDPEPARAVEEQRGYADVAPADPWNTWLALRP